MFALSRFAAKCPSKLYKEKEQNGKGSRVEDLYPPRESAASPRNNTRESKQAQERR